MGKKGLYFRDVQPLIDRGDLAFIAHSDLMQVVRPCEAVSQRLTLRRKSKQQELIEVEERVPIEKGILLAMQWRAANSAEQQKLARLSEEEARTWGVRNDKGEIKIKVLSQIKDIHAAIRQSFRHIPRNFLGREITVKGKTLSLPGRLGVLAHLGEEFVDLNASIMELATIHPSAVEEVIESLAKFHDKVSAAIKTIESLQNQPDAKPQEISMTTLARLSIDLKIMDKYLRRAEKLIGYDKSLKEKIGWGYERLMELVTKAQGRKLTGRDIQRAHGIYKMLAEEIHVNPYYAEHIVSPEVQRLGQIQGRSPKTALNYIKGAAFKLEAVALPVVQKQVLQKQAYYQRSIKEFNQDLPSFTDLAALLKGVADRMHQTLGCESVVIFLNDARSASYTIQEKLGLSDPLSGELQIRATSGLIQLLKQKSKAWFLNEVTATAGKVEDSELEGLKTCRAELLVPVLAKEDLIGLVALGERSSREEYDPEALAFLLDLSSHAALAMDGLQLRRQHKARQQELEAAREIQRSLLPRFIPKVKGCELAALCESCLEVGGDYYYLLKFSDHKVGVIVADVVGKGAPAALLMSNLQAAVKILVTESIPPGMLVEKVNSLICSSITPNRFITFFYGVLDTREKALTYTNAGHNPPLLLRADGSYIKLDKGGTVIGILPNGTYEEERIELESADLLALYTDGVTEARSPAGEEFGEARLREHIWARKWGSAEELLQQIHQSVRTFAQGEMQDDWTLVVASIL